MPKSFDPFNKKNALSFDKLFNPANDAMVIHRLKLGEQVLKKDF